MDSLVFFSIISKLILYIGVLFASGTIFYSILFATKSTESSFNARKITGLFAVIGLISALVIYALAAAQLTGEMVGAFDPEMLGILWQTLVGNALFLRVLGLCLILVGIFIGRLSKMLLVIGSLIALGSFTQIGHTADAANVLVQVLLLIHLIGISIWAGILLPLYQLSSNTAQIATTSKITHRFGRLAAFFVPILLIAGAGLSYQLLGSIENLFTTAYGQTLLIKVAIVIGLLGLAAANKLRFVPALKAGNINALNRLKYSVLVEIILIIFILSATAVLTSFLTLPRVSS